MAYHDFEWFADRLEPAQVKSDRPGAREWMTRCPVHSGSDSLHVQEKNGKALIHCFGCEAGYREVVAALEAEEDGDSAEVATQSDEYAPAGSESTPRTPTVLLPGRGEQSRRLATQKVRETPTSLRALDWLAEYCAVPRDWLETFPGLAETEDGAWVAHTWETTDVVKLRKAGSSDRVWHPKGANQPRLWPTIPDTLPPEIWLCEGETDVICLRFDGVEHAYTAGSASQPLGAEEMKYLKIAGVERIVVAYDTDKAGSKATSETLKAAKEAGLGASTAVLGDPLRGGPKDWRERHLQHGTHEPPETNAKLAAQEVWNLNDVTNATRAKLLLGRLHPDDHTILFGDGGTGKGVIASWWITRLVRELGKEVLIVDYEEHATHEWRPRIERFGCGHEPAHTCGHDDATRTSFGADGTSHVSTCADVCDAAKKVLSHVHIYQPRGPIWDEAGGIFAMCEELGVDYVIVDSVTYACLGVEVEKSVTATQYSDAMKRFKRPTLSLAHTTKADADPRHPFGSVFWSNGARITIGVVATGAFDSPRKIELKKANQGGDHAPSEIPWSWVKTALPAALKEEEIEDDSAIPRILAALKRMSGQARRSDIVREVQADGFGPIKPQTIYNRLGEMKNELTPRVTSPRQGYWAITPEGANWKP